MKLFDPSNPVSRAVVLVSSAYELRYWSIYSVLLLILFFFGLINGLGLLTGFVAVGIGGWTTGKRLRGMGL